MKELLQNNIGLGVNDVLIGFDHGDAIRHTKEPDHSSYKKLAEDLNDKFNPKNILELGCGSGNLSFWCREVNPKINYYTVDINKDILDNGLIKKENHFILRTDEPFLITEDGKNPFKFDLILSFEHFEHIEENRIPILIENIKTHCNENTLIVATASYIWRDCHPTIWSREKWINFLNNAGFSLINETILNPNNKPINFELANTCELIFKLKE